MLKKEIQKPLGMVLMGIGLLLITARPMGITGAAIGLGEIKDIAFFVAGALFIAAGLILEFRLYGSTMPSKLEDLLTRAGRTGPEIEVLPDTEFLKQLKQKGKKGSWMDLSGAQLIILPQVIEECNRQKVDQSILRYLTSNHVTARKLEQNPEINRYRNLFTDLWTEYCQSAKGMFNRVKEIGKILDGADAKLLAYGIQRGQNPTVILSDDTHLKRLAPRINEATGSNITVYGLRDYARAAA